MFNLIVAVISIALIAAMAAASIFYGGSAFSSSTATAQATTLVNNGQQISGAQQLYMIDNSGNRAGAISGLTAGNYLQALPTAPAGVVEASAVWSIDASGEYAVIALNDDTTGQQNSAAATVCAELVEQGAATSLLDGDVDLTADAVGGLLKADVDTAIGDNQFICASDAGLNVAGATGNATFVYKL